MPHSTKDHRAALRDRLTTLAEMRIATDGIAALRARDLSREAGCALGAIYSVFGDLGDVVLAVNARTFDRLARVLGATDPIPTDPDGSRACLAAMAVSYHAFARDNRHLWRALFGIGRPTGPRPPDWYMDHMERIFRRIEATLIPLLPDTDDHGRRLAARTLFGAVHGIVQLSLDEAGAGLPPDAVAPALETLVRRFAGMPP
jgi:AcrR family transcriptional regulator